MARPKLACPAAAIVHPVLSLNEDDVECQVAGHVRPVEGSPCCNPDGYVNCGIWRTIKDLERQGLGRRVLDQRTPKRHVLGSNVHRDRILT